MAGDGTAGDGTAGDGTAGDGTAGDGTAGDGTAGRADAECLGAKDRVTRAHRRPAPARRNPCGAQRPQPSQHLSPSPAARR
jgi:hypothetical protein